MPSSPTSAEETVTASAHHADTWALLGLAMLGVRLVQGWVYWAGASRRLIYSSGKLDPGSRRLHGA